MVFGDFFGNPSHQCFHISLGTTISTMQGGEQFTSARCTISQLKWKQSFNNFVVKRSERLFNQVSPDQSQEWLNGIGKKGGGIVGITKTTSALSRWALSFNLRSHLGSETKSVYGIGQDDSFTHNENNLARQKVDLKDEDNILNKLQSLHLFSDDLGLELHNIVTRDIMPQNITNDLLSASQKGHDQVIQFVQERLVADKHGKRKVAFSEPLAKNKKVSHILICI